MIRAILARRFAFWVAAKYDAIADKLEEVAPDPVYEPTTLGHAFRAHVQKIRESADMLRAVGESPSEKLRREVTASQIRAVTLDPPLRAVGQGGSR